MHFNAEKNSEYALTTHIAPVSTISVLEQLGIPSPHYLRARTYEKNKPKHNFGYFVKDGEKDSLRVVLNVNLKFFFFLGYFFLFLAPSGCLSRPWVCGSIHFNY